MDPLETSDNLLDDRRCTGTSKQSGERCKRAAKPGYQVCHYHGARGGRPPIHGLYAKHRPPSITQRIEELKGDPKLLDSRSHLAALIACFEHLVSNISAANVVDKDAIDSVAKVTEIASKAIERHHKQVSGYWLSPEKVQLVIDMLAARIQKTCNGCPHLPKLALDIQSVPMPE